jgi:tetratricopeptide (TPR) repeat protein
VHPQVEAGYAAYQAGDFPLAREAYGRALREEPSNRDALLGLAAVEIRSQRPDIAAALYTRLLQADPRDAYAQAGMLALRGAPQDPVLMETRLKNLLAADPDANALHFALGNQYARQERWAEAQQAYFKAYTADPENPDFAYNLAVSLDRLHKPRIASEYYQRALALAERRGASFERAAVEKRVQELAR